MKKGATKMSDRDPYMDDLLTDRLLKERDEIEKEQQTEEDKDKAKKRTNLLVGFLLGFQILELVVLIIFFIVLKTKF